MKKTIIALFALAGVAMGESITLSIPTGIQNGPREKTENNVTTVVDIGGVGYLTVESAITSFANGKDGGYMFNGGGIVDPAVTIVDGVVTGGEGVITSDAANGICLTLRGRTGAGGSGEAIVLSANELAGSLVESFTFSIAGSTCEQTGKSVGMTLAVIQKDGNSWTQLGDSEAGSFQTGSGSSITLTLNEAINWSDSYKVVAVIDNLKANVSGGATEYSMSGISVSAKVVPEPTTATLSLLALAGLAARRRRK